MHPPPLTPTPPRPRLQNAAAAGQPQVDLPDGGVAPEMAITLQVGACAVGAWKGRRVAGTAKPPGSLPDTAAMDMMHSAAAKCDFPLRCARPRPCFFPAGRRLRPHGPVCGQRAFPLF